MPFSSHAMVVARTRASRMAPNVMRVCIIHQPLSIATDGGDIPVSCGSIRTHAFYHLHCTTDNTQPIALLSSTAPPIPSAPLAVLYAPVGIAATNYIFNFNRCSIPIMCSRVFVDGQDCLGRGFHEIFFVYI